MDTQNSFNHEKGELLLRDVRVYSNEGEFFYELEGIYLTYEPNNMVMEFQSFVAITRRAGD